VSSAPARSSSSGSSALRAIASNVSHRRGSSSHALGLSSSLANLLRRGADNATDRRDRVQLIVVVNDERTDQGATLDVVLDSQYALPPRPCAVYSSMAVRFA